MNDFAKRFWAKVDRSGGPDACWPWTGALARGGYGKVHGPNGETLRANRVAVVLGFPGVARPRNLHSGRISAHSCDNPICCNPRHLSPATWSKNLEDAYNRLRRPREPHSLFRYHLLKRRGKKHARR